MAGTEDYTTLMEANSKRLRNRPALDLVALWEYALRLLGRRAYSTAELRDKLRFKAARKEDVTGVLSRLKNCGYLDDARFAEGFAAAKLENQGTGKIRVLNDLRKRRVSSAVASRAVEKAYSATDEIQLIEDYLKRKFRKPAIENALSEPKELASAYRRLRIAGFNPANILHVLRRLAKNPELLEGAEDQLPG